jgi:hypothetical protein
MNMQLRVLLYGFSVWALVMCLQYYASTGASATGFMTLTSQTTFDWNYVWIGMLAIPLAAGFLTYYFLCSIDPERRYGIATWLILSFASGMYISIKSLEWLQGYRSSTFAFIGVLGMCMLASIFYNGFFAWMRRLEPQPAS